MSCEEVRNIEAHAGRVKRSAKQYVVVPSFQRKFQEEWGSSDRNNHFPMMTTFEQWNYGDGQRRILPIIKKGIIIYEKAEQSSFDYGFVHHRQAGLLSNNMLTKQIGFLRELAMVGEDFYQWLCLKYFGYRSPNKEAKAT